LGNTLPPILPEAICILFCWFGQRIPTKTEQILKCVTPVTELVFSTGGTIPAFTGKEADRLNGNGFL
jgi:hypothetical protein